MWHGGRFRIRLKEQLEDTDGRATRWRELAERAFLFSREAKERFESGSLEDKREILVALGSNLVLKDKILRIQLQKPFDLIEEGLQALRSKNSPFEPQIFRVTANENGGREAVILKWCARRDSNPISGLEVHGSIRLPSPLPPEGIARPEGRVRPLGRKPPYPA